MKILETRVYRGPNLYASWPVIRLRVDLGELEDFPTAKLPGFSERLLALIPSLHGHTCSYEEEGGFVRRMAEDEGTWLGHVLEHVAIELQVLVGTPVTFGKTRSHGLPRGQYHVVYSYVEEAVGLAAGDLALGIIRHLLPPEREMHDPSPFDFQAEFEKLVRTAQRHALGPSTAALVRAAEERDIPWIRLNEGSLIQLGYGKHQKRLQATLTSETRHIAAEIASDNRVMAERAVKAIGLDVGGVDFLSPDISRSYKEAGGVIVEINAAPGFRMHIAPTEGKPRDVAGPVIDMLFPRGSRCRIPLAAVTGTNGKTTTTRMVGHILKLSGHKVGMATTDGVYIDSVLTVRGDMTGPWASQIVLRDPSVDAAVLETARGGIVRSGLGWRKCNVGAVLNVASDHLGLGGVEDLDDLGHVKQIVVEVAQDYCVLNADDERVAAMAEVSPAELIFVTMDPGNERVRRHVRAGGRAVALEPGLNGRMLVLYQGELKLPLLWARQIPATIEGRAFHNVQNAMFAAAIAHGMGIEVDDVRQGLRTFSNDFFQAPGRLNFYNEHPFRGVGELEPGELTHSR